MKNNESMKTQITNIKTCKKSRTKQKKLYKHGYVHHIWYIIWSYYVLIKNVDIFICNKYKKKLIIMICKRR